MSEFVPNPARGEAAERIVGLAGKNHTHAHGTEGVHFFTRGKVVTSRWLDPSHGGINLGFPQNR